MLPSEGTIDHGSRSVRAEVEFEKVVFMVKVDVFKPAKGLKC